MKRWIFRILLLLTLGAVTTIAVAWTCVAMHSTHFALLSYVGTTYPIDPAWRGQVIADFGTIMIDISPETWGPAGVLALDGTQNLPKWSRGSMPPTTSDIQNRVSILEIAGGWPCVSNFCRESSHATTGTSRLEAGVRLPFTSPTSFMPLRPIWPGFVLNTLIYSGIWFALLLAIAAARRTIRRRRGRCPRCAYNLRGSVTSGHDARSTGCPECGWRRGG